MNTQRIEAIFSAPDEGFDRVVKLFHDLCGLIPLPGDLNLLTRVNGIDENGKLIHQVYVVWGQDATYYTTTELFSFSVGLDGLPFEVQCFETFPAYQEKDVQRVLERLSRDIKARLKGQLLLKASGNLTTRHINTDLNHEGGLGGLELPEGSFVHV